MRPLEGIRVIELAGLAPVPYCGLILADFGADVIRVDRLGASSTDQLGAREALRGRRPQEAAGRRGRAAFGGEGRRARGAVPARRDGAPRAGADVALRRNPRLVYARLTGFGQDGPYAPMAGHDINYIAISGALSLIGRAGEKPLAPVNLLGDFAGGGMLCAMGILLALMERHRSGRGQVVDTAMVDGPRT